MARDKNGWIKLHSAILDKDFSLVEYKIFTGLLLLANSLKHNSPGLVDLSLRDTASRLRVSIGRIANYCLRLPGLPEAEITAG